MSPVKCRKLASLIVQSQGLLLSIRDVGRFTPSKGWAPALLQDFHRYALSQFHARRSQDSADEIGHVPLAADHFSDIAGVDAQLKHGPPAKKRSVG